MKKLHKIVIVMAVVFAIGFIYINETTNKDINDAHDHSVSQLSILEEALKEELPLLIKFSTHS